MKAGVQNNGYFIRRDLKKVAAKFCKKFEKLDLKKLAIGSEFVVKDLKGTYVIATWTGVKFIADDGYLFALDVKGIKDPVQL